MRIIQVLRVLGFGGAENHVLTLSLGLRDRGHDVMVAARENSWIAEQCRLHQLPLTHLRMRGVADVFSYWKLHRLIKTWGADVVHGHLAHPSQYAKLAVLGTKAVALSTAHSTVSSRRMKGCHHIIAVSGAVVESLANDGYSRKMITRVYNGVPDVVAVERKELREALGISQDRFAVVCAGRFQPDKGQDILVEIAKLCESHIHFYFIGNHNTAFGRGVQAAANGHSHIHFLGYRNDVQQILPAFDVYAAPSRREALSLSILEAAAARVPTVGMRVGGIPESVADGETGLLVPFGDIRAFVDAIRRLSVDAALRHRLGEQARHRYEHVFTVENMLGQTERIYESQMKK